MYNAVNTVAPSFLIGSSSFLQVTRTTVKSWISSKFSQIQTILHSKLPLSVWIFFFTYLRSIQNILITCWLSGERSLPFGLLVQKLLKPMTWKLVDADNSLVWWRYQKVKVLSWPWPQGIYIWKLKLTFLRNWWAILNQILYVSFQEHGNEILLK